MEIKSELSGLITMQSKHTWSHIFYKNLATGFPVVKILIKYNSNSLEENEEEEEPINIGLLSKMLVLKC